jgi:O-antigen ligase
VLFSFSRASIGSLVLGLVVIAAVYAARRGGGRRALALLVAMIFAGIASLAALDVTGKLSFLQSRAHEQGYDSQRFGAQDFAIHLATRHPLGVGPGQFEQYSLVSVHETYLRALAEVGILGVVLVAALLLATLGYALRNAARGIDTYGVGSATLLGAWVGFVGSGFVIDTLHWRHLWVVAAFVWAGAARGAP